MFFNEIVGYLTENDILLPGPKVWCKENALCSYNLLTRLYT